MTAGSHPVAQLRQHVARPLIVRLMPESVNTSRTACYHFATELPGTGRHKIDWRGCRLEVRRSGYGGTARRFGRTRWRSFEHRIARKLLRQKFSRDRRNGITAGLYL